MASLAFAAFETTAGMIGTRGGCDTGPGCWFSCGFTDPLPVCRTTAGDLASEADLCTVADDGEWVGAAAETEQVLATTDVTASEFEALEAVRAPVDDVIDFTVD